MSASGQLFMSADTKAKAVDVIVLTVLAAVVAAGVIFTDREPRVGRDRACGSMTNRRTRRRS